MVNIQDSTLKTEAGCEKRHKKHSLPRVLQGLFAILGAKIECFLFADEMAGKAACVGSEFPPTIGP